MGRVAASASDRSVSCCSTETRWPGRGISFSAKGLRSDSRGMLSLQPRSASGRRAATSPSPALRPAAAAVRTICFSPHCIATCLSPYFGALFGRAGLRIGFLPAREELGRRPRCPLGGGRSLVGLQRIAAPSAPFIEHGEQHACPLGNALGRAAVRQQALEVGPGLARKACLGRRNPQKLTRA